MKTLTNKWKLLSMKFNNELHEALLQQHHAAQFIALTGHHLVSQKADDSNTNMEYISNGMMLLGNELSNGLKLVLHLTTMELGLLDTKNDIKQVINLVGKTKNEAFVELKESFSALGVDVSTFNNELHYEMPEHKLDADATFQINNEEYFVENAIARHNAEVVIGEIVKNIENAEPVRIWPHHFDTGSFVPVSHNEKGELSQSIGLGLAIPDTMIDEPYYYLSFWSEENLKDSDKLKALNTGEWMTPNWNGATLRLSDILVLDSAEKQYELVKSFYDQGIEIVMNHLKK